jgi:hypothetical protein
LIDPIFSRRGGQIPEKSLKMSKCVRRSKADKEIGKLKRFFGLKIHLKKNGHARDEHSG